MEDLDAAIGLGREGLELYPLGNPQQPVSLSNLVTYLPTRYN